jgi:hypothetical protein
MATPDPLKTSRLDQIEDKMRHTPDDMMMAVYPNAIITAVEIRSMIAELRRRRHKMGYTK